MNRYRVQDNRAMAITFSVEAQRNDNKMPRRNRSVMLRAAQRIENPADEPSDKKTRHAQIQDAYDTTDAITRTVRQWVPGSSKTEHVYICRDLKNASYHALVISVQLLFYVYQWDVHARGTPNTRASIYICYISMRQRSRRQKRCKSSTEVTLMGGDSGKISVHRGKFYQHSASMLKIV